MSLSRNEVIDGALKLLDKEGLDALTMRRLADSLGVQAGAIYWHFADKQDLIDALAESFMGGILEPAPKGRWDAQLAEISRRTVSALVSHRDAARLATLALRPGPNGLALSEAMLRIMRDAGFGKRATLWATSVLGYYMLGYATDVQATEAAKARGLKAVIKSLDKTLDHKQYPKLREITRNKGIEALISSGQFEARFEYGLQVILSGIKATQPSARRRRVSARRTNR
jgi:TetR/AcrR family tetracycline transcriptional repressor